MSEERINILMVDDSATNLFALESILHGPDRNLVSASSGEDALRYLLDNEVAVILMDVYMPGLDGLETAELIRGRDRSRDIPIIFLTADSTGGRHLSRGYSLGAVDYIVKPVEPDILRSKVAVFVELFKKTQEIKRQAELLHEKNLELENANLTRLTMLIGLGQELAAEREPNRVLEKFCRSARHIVDAQEAGVGLVNGTDNSLKYFFHCGSSEETFKNPAPPVSRKALDTLIKERRPLRLNEVDDLIRDSSGMDHAHSFLGAPIVSAGDVLGWVYLLNKNNAEDFSEADERLAATLSTQVAISYENAKLYHDAQRHAEALQQEMGERKQAEEERAKLLVREQAARREAEEANRTKDEFLATLSHELRTPLSAILGWTHLVRTGKLDETQMTRAFETIERNARSQSQLIDDLLDVSRIITGKLQIDFRPVDLFKVIDTAVDAVRPSMEAKSIEFETPSRKETCFVLGDSNRLQQIFWNLFNNALKFTPEEGKVSVRCERKRATVEISVSDSGIGISKEFLPYIFDRFRQADGSTTRVHGGLGLGLSIVRHLVELHRGTVAVESEGPNRGAKFTINIPLAPAGTIAKSHHLGSLEGDGLLGPDSAHLLDGLKILVVDDEADSRELVTAILMRSGSEVRSSVSAAEAIAALKEWHPDVLISDIGMPYEDGYGLLKKVRKLRAKWAKQITAVALTAYATDEDRSKALSAGFQTHVTKPVEAHALVKSIASAVGRKAETS